MNISYRLKEIRTKLGLSQKNFGEILEIAQTSYANYEGGKSNLPANVLGILKEKLNINLNWLICGEGEMFNKNNESITSFDNLDVCNLPITNLRLSAGPGISYPSEEIYVDDVLPVPKKLVRIYGRLNAAIVRGDSMEPTLKDGEPVAYTDETDFTNDGIYVISWNNELYIKRISKMGNLVSIISDNKMYSTKEIDLSQNPDLEIKGRVVFWLHMEDRMLTYSTKSIKAF